MDTTFNSMMSEDIQIQLFTDIFASSEIFHTTDINLAKQVLDGSSEEAPEELMESNFINGVATIFKVFSDFITKIKEIYQRLKTKFRYFQSKYMQQSTLYDELLTKVQMHPVLLMKRECKLSHYKFDLDTGDKLAKQCVDVLDYEIDRLKNAIGILGNLDILGMSQDEIYDTLKISDIIDTDIQSVVFKRVSGLNKFKSSKEPTVRQAIQRAYHCGNDNPEIVDSHFSVGEVRQMIRYCSSLSQLIDLTNERYDKLEQHADQFMNKINSLQKSASKVPQKYALLTTLSMYAAKILTLIHELDVSILVYGNVYKSNMQNLIRLNGIIVNDQNPDKIAISHEYYIN